MHESACSIREEKKHRECSIRQVTAQHLSKKFIGDDLLISDIALKNEFYRLYWYRPGLF